LSDKIGTYTLSQLTEDIITQGTQTLVVLEDEGDKTGDLILNISIEDLIDNIGLERPFSYLEILDFLKEVMYFCFFTRD